MSTYLIVSAEVYNETYSESHPGARHNQEVTEYLISCEGDTGNLTALEAKIYIAENWIFTEEGE